MSPFEYGDEVSRYREKEDMTGPTGNYAFSALLPISHLSLKIDRKRISCCLFLVGVYRECEEVLSNNGVCLCCLDVILFVRNARSPSTSSPPTTQGQLKFVRVDRESGNGIAIRKIKKNLN